MKKNIFVFIVLIIFASLALAGGGCVSKATVKPADYADKDELRLGLIALSDECKNLVEELDALLARYAREARKNMAIINDKRQAAILAQEENKKYFVGLAQNMVQEIHYAILVIHLIVGFALVYLAMKAFKKTKYPPMALLAVGFALIVIGDTVIGDIVAVFDDNVMGEILEEGIEIAGFIALILAIKRS